MGGDIKNIKLYTWVKLVTYIASLILEPGSCIAIMSKNYK